MAYDFSPLRLRTSLALAKQVFNPQNSEADRLNQILLRPNEAYYQVSNFDTNYGFTEATAMYIVDCSDTQLADVTAQATFDILTDSDGVQQLAYEVGFLDIEFYQKTVFIKIVTDTYTFWSAPCNISNKYNHQYVRLEYGYYGMSFELGIDFSEEPLLGKSQTIGIRAHYNDIQTKREDKGYTQMSTGQEVTSKALDTSFFNFKIEYSKPFDLLWLSKVLSADVIYIGWGEYLPTVFRVSNKPAQKAGERIAASNLKENEFDCCLDLSETKIWRPQMLDPFEVVARFPDPGTYTGFNFTGAGCNLMTLEFNRDIANIPPVYSVKLFKNGGLFLNVPYPGIASDGISEINFSDNLMQINFDDQIFYNVGTSLPNNGIYDVVVQSLYDEFGSEWGGYAIGQWRIVIQDADFDSADFEPTEFFTDA